VDDSSVNFKSGGKISASSDGSVQLPFGSTIGGLNPGSIVIKGRRTTVEALPVEAEIGDAYVIGDDLHIFFPSTTEGAPNEFVNVGSFIGPTGQTGPTGCTGMTGAVGTGPTGQRGSAFFTLETTSNDIRFPQSNLIVKGNDSSSSFVYTRESYNSFVFTFLAPHGTTKMDIGLMKTTDVAEIESLDDTTIPHLIRFQKGDEFLINEEIEAYNSDSSVRS
jgi:hypothetical protein